MGYPDFKSYIQDKHESPLPDNVFGRVYFREAQGK